MKAEFINPFIQSVSEVFETMPQCPVEAGTPCGGTWSPLRRPQGTSPGVLRRSFERVPESPCKSLFSLEASSVQGLRPCRRFSQQSRGVNSLMNERLGGPNNQVVSP